jgi:LysM repeat protein
MSAFDTDTGPVLTNNDPTSSRHGEQYRVRPGEDNGQAGSFHDYKGGGSVFVSDSGTYAPPPPVTPPVVVGTPQQTTNGGADNPSQTSPSTGSGGGIILNGAPTLVSGSAPSSGTSPSTGSGGGIVINPTSPTPSNPVVTAPAPVPTPSTGNTNSGGIVLNGLSTNLGGTGPTVLASTTPTAPTATAPLNDPNNVVLVGGGSTTPPATNAAGTTTEITSSLPTNLGGTGPTVLASTTLTNPAGSGSSSTGNSSGGGIVINPTGPVGDTSIKIAHGDTLSGIAAAHDTTVKELLALNPSITNPDVIDAGKTINVPLGGGGVSLATTGGSQDLEVAKPVVVKAPGQASAVMGGTLNDGSLNVTVSGATSGNVVGFNPPTRSSYLNSSAQTKADEQVEHKTSGWPPADVASDPGGSGVVAFNTHQSTNPLDSRNGASKAAEA